MLNSHREQLPGPFALFGEMLDFSTATTFQLVEGGAVTVAADAGVRMGRSGELGFFAFEGEAEHFGGRREDGG